LHEITWLHFDEIRWLPSFETGWLRFGEILQSSLNARLDPGSYAWEYQESLKNIFPEDLPMVQARIQEAIDLRKNFLIEFRVSVQEKIHWLHVEGRAIYDDHRAPTQIIFVSQEITQRKENEFCLAKQNQEMEVIKKKLDFTLSSAGMVALPGVRSEIKFGSPELCKMFDILDQNTQCDFEFLMSRVHPDDRGRIQSNRNSRMVQGGGQIDEESRIIMRDGQIRWIKASGTDLSDDLGGERYVVLQDITERKLIENQIKQKNAELLLEKNKLERFSSIIAHDLKNPLSSIILSADLSAKSQSMEEIKKKLQSIKAIGTRMANLIDEVLLLAKAGNDISSTKENVSLNRLLELVLSNLDAAISENQAVIEIKNELPEVFGNEYQLLQLFQNLISNALKFRSNQIPKLTITCSEVDEHFLIKITDNGVGIDLSQSNKIFEAFQRYHLEKEGNGLGLPICKQIVEQHGGKIWVESQVGVGSEFSFTLRKALP
jgi:signal transduction histidine kinase